MQLRQRNIRRSSTGAYKNESIKIQYRNEGILMQITWKIKSITNIKPSFWISYSQKRIVHMIFFKSSIEKKIDFYEKNNAYHELW